MTYRDAGVDLEAADAVVERISEAVTATWGPDVVGGFGGFAGGFRIPARYTDPVLMMSTDGIGTKLDLARRLGALDGVGHDLVAMVVDDLAAAGAEPLALTDYIAVGRLDPEEVSRIVSSIAAACTEAGVALIGGETAEHPGTMPPDALDVAASAVGVVNGDALFDPATIAAGDVVVGVSSPNLRSNGFSLVRAIVGEVDPTETVDGEPWADLLLAPSVIYARAALAARPHVKAYAHITGGGLPGNLARVLPAHLDAVVDEQRWVRPPVFDQLARRGNVEIEEMRRVFNMGIGFAAICAKRDADAVISAFGGERHPAWTIAHLEPGRGVVRYEPSTHRGNAPKP